MELPPVCLVSGKSGELVRKEKTLNWQPRWLWYLRVLVTMIGLPFLLSFFARLDMAPGLGTAWASLVLYAIVVGLCLAIPFSWFFGGRWASKVHVVWFVERARAENETAKRRFWGMLTVIGVLAAVVLVSAIVASNNDSLVPLVWVAVFAAIVAFGRARRRALPVYLGRYDELNVILLPEPFIRRVQQMIIETD